MQRLGTLHTNMHCAYISAHAKKRCDKRSMVTKPGGGWWKAQRTWSNRFRSLLIRCDKKCANYEAFGHLAFAVIIFKQTGLF